ncbi:MAG: methylmalonyl-CoA epimerase [Deltaproteobacteria bacterium]|nr:MAG: methylmalonyl-CoA epimerase [Deltaproteobacteria bacterium]
MRLHHVGLVVKDVEKVARSLEDFLGLTYISGPTEDPIQRVRAIFLELGWGKGLSLELLEPTSEDSPVVKFQRRGGGIHHLCFEVEDIEGEIERLRERGVQLVKEPVPAVGFGGRRIAFLFPVKGFLVELVEKKAPGR